MVAMICGCSFLIRSATVAGVHPLQALDAGGVAALQDARDQVGGAVVAERLGQHAADVFLVGHHRGAALGLLVELVDHFLDLVARHDFSAAMAAPSFCTSRGPRCLSTSAASSSPRVSSSMALLVMPSSLPMIDPY
jgi:hypothetical protein